MHKSRDKTLVALYKNLCYNKVNLCNLYYRIEGGYYERKETGRQGKRLGQRD